MRLSEKLEAADGRSRELDIEVWKAFHPDIAQNALSHAKGMWPKNCSEDETKARTQSFYKRAAPTYTTSIDAALTLLPDGWGVTYVSHPMPKCTWAAVREYTKDKDGVSWTGKSNRQSGEIHASTPALALCAAICRAKVEG